MRRAALALLVVPLIALWLYGCDQAENPVETEAVEAATHAPLFSASKLPVCHLNGTGEYVLVSISDNALPTHVAHGDEAAGGALLDLACLEYPIDDWGRDGVPDSEDNCPYPPNAEQYPKRPVHAERLAFRTVTVAVTK